MPDTIALQAIPVPTADNLLPVVAALRNALIAQTNTDAGRANVSGSIPANNTNQAMPNPSQFTLTSQVIVPVTYTVVIVGGTGTASVTVPQLSSLAFTNAVTGETLVWTAPGKYFFNGTVGAAL